MPQAPCRTRGGGLLGSVQPKLVQLLLRQAFKAGQEFFAQLGPRPCRSVQ